MKKSGAILSLVLIVIVIASGVCFAANEGNLKINDLYPNDGTTGTPVDNLSVKLYFNENMIPANEKIKTHNEKAITLKDDKGKNVPILVKYNPHKDKKGQVIILADAVSATTGNDSKATKIKEDTKYTFTVDGSFTATNGDTLGNDKVISFTTINQSRATKIQMALMGVMVVFMIVFTVRSSKKEAAKKEDEKKKKQPETVNPYKVAKKTGKSVEEIVRKDQEKKAKQAAAEERKKARDEKTNSREQAVEDIAGGNMRVKGPRPIAAAGSAFVAAANKPKTEKKRNNIATNPKNQTGKQKNKKNK